MASLIRQIPKIEMISCGKEHIGALDEEGHVWMIGSNGFGCLGLGHRERMTTFKKIQNLNDIVEISCGKSSMNFLLPLDMNISEFYNHLIISLIFP